MEGNSSDTNNSFGVNFVLEPVEDNLFNQAVQRVLATRVGTITVTGALLFVISYLPSIILNSLIVASYVRCTFLRTPLNLLFASFSGLSLVSHVVLLLIGSVLHPIMILNGVCVWTEVDYAMLSFFVFALTPLTIAVIALFQCLIIGGTVVSYRHAAIALIVTWTYAIVIMLIALIVEVTLTLMYSPVRTCTPVGLPQDQREFRVNLRVASNVIQAVLFDIPCFVLITIGTITSCVRYHKNILRREAGLQRRILLLPILMIGFLSFTTLVSRLLVPFVPVFAVRLQNSLLTPISYVLVRLLSQSNSFLFAGLLIFLNKGYRKGIKNVLLDFKKNLSATFKKKRFGANRVYPETTRSTTST